MKTISRILTALFVILFCVGMHAGVEKLVTSRCGKTGFRPIVIPSTGTSLTIQDQWYPYMQVHDFDVMDPNRWDEVFRVKSAKSRVVLRYDDATHYAPADPWVIRITYDIDTYDSSGTVFNRYDEVLEISYDPTLNYTDIDMNEYTDAHKAIMTITNVEYWSDGNTAGTAAHTLPTELKDVYLDLENEVERFYYLSNAQVRVERYSNTTDNTLWLGWDYIQGAESYDVEWLFIDAGNASLSDDFAYDWRNATRVNVPGNHYQIELAYPKGILLTRVRPVGVDVRNFVDNGFVTRYDGTWNYTIESGTTNGDATTITAGDIRTNITTGREEDLNWQYSASYAEDGKRKDVISFYDGSLYGRQTVTRSNTDSTLIVAEPRYDSEGRPAVSILPTPVMTDTTLNILNYQRDFNPNFGLADFDYDARILDPLAMDTTTSLADGTTTGRFYSGSNASTERGQQFQATTHGYAYTEVQYKNDGTNRPSAEGGVGPNQAIGSGHEVRYYYGTPTAQEELDRLFGNEVGYVEHYQKNMVVDPNGVVGVTYLDQEGRVIATALGGNCPDSLLPLDHTNYDPVPITADLLGNNNLEDGAKVSHSTITVVGTDVEYVFDYNLGGDTACGGDCYPTGETCPDCRYDLEIRVTNEDGSLVTPVSGDNPIVATNIGSASHTFTMELSTGVYHVMKTVRMNEATVDSLKADFIAKQLAGEGCTNLVSTEPEPCALDCEEACTQLYKRRNPEGEGYLYYDLNGDLLGSDLADAAEAQGYIDACKEQLCDNPPMPDPCQLRYNNMLLDMSPGGQYFDNLPEKYVPDNILGDEDRDGDGDVEELILNPAYDENEWLEAHFSSSAMLAAINAVWAGTDFTTWDEVRENWDEDWAVILVEFHPEYCAWNYYCNWGCEVHDDLLNEDIPYGNEEGHAYDQIFFYSTDGNYPNTSNGAGEQELFNPTNLGYNSTPNGAGVDNRSYQPYDVASPIYTGGHFVVDPRMQCDWNICEDSSAMDRLNMQLQRFLPLYDDNDMLIPDAYHSIWYVIDDPDNIHTGTPLSTGLSQSTIDFYVALHGDGISVDGILTTGGGTITPFQFFAGVYGYYRQLVIEQGFEYSAATAGTGSVHDCQEAHFDNAYGHLETAEPASPVSEDGFTVYFPENAVLALHGDGCGPVVFGMPSGMDEYIGDLDELYGGEENTIETGYSSQASCSCENLHAWITANGLDVALGDEDYETIADAINGSLDYCTATGHDPDYSAAEVEAWLDECDEEEPDMEDLNTNFFPPDLACPPETTEVAATNVNELLQDECEAENGALANLNDSIIIYAQINVAAVAWVNHYRAHCLGALDSNESFTVEYTLQEYQYTLYYYDQAGTLVKTIPPEGVKIITLSDDRDSDPFTDGEEIKAWRNFWRDSAYIAGAVPGTDIDYTPAIHGMVTNYQYNSLQQPVQSINPDITRETKFFYDPLGRLIVSQDARQYETGDLWSYVLYDDLGRIYESGEIENTTPMTETIARATTGTTYATWLGFASGKTQVVHTQYETSLTGIATLFPDNEQKNTRNRVTSITWEAVDDADPDTWDNASHFSYDIHGNVNYLIQENTALNAIGQGRKHIRYEYDLISGNVLAVHYEEGEFDEFHHKYEYDADNRVTVTYSSRNGVIWEKEQKNFYYLTGPLLRQEIGDKTVQAMDYAYTAQGWIKCMNAGSISSTRDMGRDGYSERINNTVSTNMYVGTDASGFVLGYYDNTGHNGDYWAPAISTAGTSNSYLPVVTHSGTRNDYYNLYNGNISMMVTSLTDENQDAADNQLTAYQYDQLNRIKQVRAHRNYNTFTNTFTTVSGDDGKYAEYFEYDRNGNIMAVERNGNNTAVSGNQQMDDFTYKYYDNTGAIISPYPIDGLPLNATNRLAYVDDATSSGHYTTDIDDQVVKNYTYDGNGNLVTDTSEEIGHIDWYANGKIKSITRLSTSSKSDLEFIYDASGNRIVKIVKPRDGTGVLSQLHWTYTYYVRDASGNVMAVYERTFESTGGDDYNDKFNCAELHVYGSSRVGTDNVDSLMTYSFESTGFGDGYNEEFAPSYDAVGTSLPCDDHCKYNYRRELGNKQYEVTNHLGNVLATVSDRRLYVDDYSYTSWSSGTKYAYDATRNIYYQSLSGTYQRTSSADNKADYYSADVISYSDYYAFGAQMDGRYGGDYRYNFNGKETDVESDLQDYGMRIYNARLGRFLSVDPDATTYPFLSPYCYAANNPTSMLDINGRGPYPISSRSYSMQLTDPASGKTYLYLYDCNYIELDQTFGSYGHQFTTYRVIVSYDMYEVTTQQVTTEGSPLLMGSGTTSTVHDYTYMGTGHNTSNQSHFSSSDTWGEPTNVINTFYPVGDPLLRQPSGTGSLARTATSTAPIIEGAGIGLTFGYNQYMGRNFKRTDFPTGDFAYTGRYGQYLGLSFNEMPTLSIGIRVLKFTGRTLGHVGTAMSVASYAFDVYDFTEGTISGAKFAYRSAFFFGGTAAGLIWGGPVGVTIGGFGLLGEVWYGGASLFISESAKFDANFNHAVNNGWKPGQ